MARVLLREDGVIFVHNDSNEFAHIKVLMDEIFSSENYIDTIIIKATPNARDYGHIGKMHEYVHLYSKNYKVTKTFLLLDKTKKFSYKDEKGRFNIHPLYNSNVNFNISNRPNLYYPFYLNPKSSINKDFLEISLEKRNDFIEIYPPKSLKDNIQFVWRWGKEKSKDNLNQEIVGYKTSSGEYRIIQKMRTTEKIARSIWDETEMSNRRATEDLQKLFGKKVFSYPKSEYLIKRILEISTIENDIVFDYHLGSGTTATVAHKMGRQYIGIEQMDCVETITIGRLKKVIGIKVKKADKMFEELEYDTGGVSEAVNWQGGGDFIYCELLKYNETFIDKIQTAETTEELVVLWKDIAENSFLNWYVNPEMPEEAVNDFIAIGKNENGLDKQKKLLAEMLNKNQLYVNLSEIDDADFDVSEEDKKLNQLFYGNTYNG